MEYPPPEFKIIIIIIISDFNSMTFFFILKFYSCEHKIK